MTLLRGSLLASVSIVLGLGGFTGYEVYQWHYLSPGLHRTLMAAMDSNATEGDIAAYMRDARLQVMTKRDEQVLGKFETCINLFKDSAEISQRHFNETLDSLNELGSRNTLVDKLNDIRSEYLRSRLPVPPSLQNDIQKAISDARSQRKQEEDTYETEEKRAKSEAATAQELYRELRADLGLPPLTVGERTK